MTPSEGARARTGRELEMLDSLLALGGLVLLRDSVEWEGRSLLKALVKKSALCGEQVHILGCEVSEEEFREGAILYCVLFSLCRLVYHDFFRDPLNWSKTEEAFPGGPLGALRAMCKRTDPVPVTIALDSLSWLLLRLPCTTLCQALHAVSHQDSCPGETPPSLFPLIHLPLPRSVPLFLSTLEETSGFSRCFFIFLTFLPRQRPTHQTLWFSILPDFSLHLQEGPSVESQARTRKCSLGSGQGRENKSCRGWGWGQGF
uniref:Elongator complex protein 5 n=1 Tax=Nomascus leucogenys TaxID=61853 RepID=G1R9D0_NOMLE